MSAKQLTRLLLFKPRSSGAFFWMLSLSRSLAIDAPLNLRPGTPNESSQPTLSDYRQAFAWSQPAGAGSYLLNLRDLTAPGTPVVNYPIFGGSVTSTQFTLIHTHAYRWNMWAYTGGNTNGTRSPLSVTNHFRVGASDLLIVNGGDGITFSPNPVYAGDRLTVQYIIRNSGTCASRPCLTQVQFKEGSSPTTTVETFVQTTNILVGDSLLQGAELQIPTTAAESEYTIHVILDDRDEAGQGSNTNNDVHRTDFGAIQVLRRKPNLTPFRPQGWDGPVVVSKRSNSTTDDIDLAASDTIFISWAGINSGSGPAAQSFYSTLYLDDEVVGVWQILPAIPGAFFPVIGHSLGSLPIGQHTIRLKVDSGIEISEISETDNEYTKTITISPKLYPLTVSVIGEGDLRLDPPGQSAATMQSAANSPFARYYPEGTRITISATPSEGKQFSEWFGDSFGVASQLTLVKAAKSENLSGRFIPLAMSSFIDLRVALTTPATLNITVPTQLGWITVCEESIDLLAWVVRCAHVGTGTPHVEDLLIDSTGNNFRRSQVEQALSAPAFLNFPIRVDPNNGQELNATNAKVSAILDHHGKAYAGGSNILDGVIGTLEGHARHVLESGRPFEHKPNGQIVFSSGKLALIEPTVQDVLNLPFNYVGTQAAGLSALQYDSHNGYDYSYPTGTDVYAAAGGDVMVDEDFSVALGFDASLTNIASNSMRSWRGLFIDHRNGYYTFYAHFSVIDERYVDTNDSRIWKPRKVSVDVNKPLGQIGDFGVVGSPHLHFGVYRLEEKVEGTNRVKKLRIIDPYGKRASNRDEVTRPLWL